VFTKKLTSGEWKSDDEMYEFVMVYLELIAQGRLAFDEETGKILLLKPVGDPPSDQMRNRIQNRSPLRVQLFVSQENAAQFSVVNRPFLRFNAKSTDDPQRVGVFL
jgi:hypothetical protein